MARQPLLDLPGGARTVVWIVAQGLAADTLKFYDLAEPGALTVETPNLKAMAQIGTSILHCAGLAPGEREEALARLWSNADALGLPGHAARKGKLWLSMLPYAADKKMAADPAVPRCEVRVNLASPGEKPLQWDDLMATNPEAMVENVPDGPQLEALIERILARFPGRATQRRGSMLAQSPLDAWLEWLGDAFLRSVWYTLARSDGTLAFLYHPGPGLYADQAGGEGYRRGVEALDDLVGRLMMLQEHDQADNLLLIVSGDYAWSAESKNTVPVLLLGPDTESGTIYADCTVKDVAALVEASL